MSTKNNPGAFRCYEAALPDEPIFTILARDPAAPATLQFWASQWEAFGKVETAEDRDRIEDARRDADAMQTWREANRDPFGTGPTWRGVGINDEMGGPICEKPDNTVYVYAERDGDEAVRLSIEWLKRITGQLVDGEISRTMFAGLIDHACHAPDRRRRERVVPVEEAAADAAKRDARTITMMNAIQNAITVIDDLSVSELRKSIFEPVRRILFNGLQETPVAVFHQPTEQRGKIEEQFETPSYLIPFRGLTPGEQVVVDSQPDDLAHSPEVPPHRFSVFHKGENYAYARGLEINPVHLPVALDAMHKDGWDLVSIFGQTDSKHVGFIFRRAHRGGVVKVNADYDGIRVRGPHIPATLPQGEMIHPRQGGIASQKSDRFLRGDPLDEIRSEDPPVAEAVAERFVIEYAERLPDGSCQTTRVAGAEWPEWAQPCFARGRGLMP